jgi:hypothetical protein
MDDLSVFMQQFNHHLFWDVDVSELDPEASKRLIIQRVFMRGSLKDMQSVISNYGQNKVVEVLCRLNYLDPKTLNFVSKLFNTPKDKFRCYTRKQSSPQHWSS